MWLDGVLAGAGALSSLSWSLACPFHCGPSLVFPVALAFVCGTFFGILLTFGLWISLRPALDFAPPSTSSAPGFEAPLRRRVPSRLRGYLHE